MADSPLLSLVIVTLALALSLFALGLSSLLQQPRWKAGRAGRRPFG